MSWRRPGPLWLAVWIAVVVIAVDQLTKHWALNALSDGRTIDLFWTLRFKLAFNTGMSFSRGTGMGPIIGVVAVVVIAVLLRAAARSTRTFTVVAAGVVAGGAAGNVIDRLFRGDRWMRGAVVDFIDPQWFPIFNVADSAIVVGGALLVWASMREAAHE